MGSEYQPGPPESKGLEIPLVLLGVNVAWPALLVGVVARFLIQQRTRNPFPYWIAAGGPGAVGPTGCATRLQQTSRVARSSSRAHPVLSLPCERLRRNAPSSRKHNSNEGRSRAASVKCLSRCTSHGKIHAFESRTNYQKIVMRFLNWCRDQHNMRDLARIDEQADELASLFLLQRMEQGKSAWTLTTERSALRLFFQDGQLTDGVALPKRRREDIKRSRQPAVRDKHIKETIPEQGQTECLIGRVSLGALSSAFNKQALRG